MTNDNIPPMIAMSRILGMNNPAIIKSDPAIARSKNLSVNPVDNPSDKLILLIFLPTTAVNTSPALFMGEKFPAKIPMVFTTKLSLNLVVWLMIKPHRRALINITTICITAAIKINHQSAVSRAVKILDGPIHNINTIIRVY